MCSAIETIKLLNQEISSKNSLILNLQQQISELKATTSELLEKTNFLEHKNSSFSESFLKSNLILQETSQKLNYFESLSKSLQSKVAFLEQQIQSHSKSCFELGQSEIDNVKIILEEQQIRHSKEKEELLEEQERLKVLLTELTEKKTKKLLSKRNNWVDSLPKISLPCETSNPVPEISEKPLSEPLSAVIKDVEALLGWRITYQNATVTLSAFNKSFVIQKVEYQNDIFYNIHLSPESLPLMSSSPYTLHLFEHKNFPAFFSEILLSEYSGIIS